MVLRRGCTQAEPRPVAALAVGFMDNAIEVYALELPSGQGSSPGSRPLMPMLRVHGPPRIPASDALFLI